MPYDEYKIAVNFLPAWLKISRTTFYRWLYLPNDSHFEIPANCMVYLSNFFECEMKELYLSSPPTKDIKNAFCEFKEVYYVNTLFK